MKAYEEMACLQPGCPWTRAVSWKRIFRAPVRLDEDHMEDLLLVHMETHIDPWFTEWVDTATSELSGGKL